MGGSESTGRKVSFGMDEEERVRVLRGVRLSDEVVNRMKDSNLPSKDQSTSTASGTTSGPTTFPSKAGPSASHSASTSKDGAHKPTARGVGHQYAEEDLYRRYEKEQALIQEELARLAKREREAAHERLSSSVLREKNITSQERRKAEHLPADLDEWAKELEQKEAELQRLNTFYREQLNSIEKKNLEIYKLTAEQFHTAASNAELRVKQRSYDPVCMDLQSNILKCYAENKQERLNCSDLAKEYGKCVSAAQKNLLFNHG
uniref:MICOS complex subunit mic25-a n=1 Tax=Xenopus laevis TaxID=8355 RepID=MC25A_XENLA|nr:RecName: Full=MICOS complex subunit mic25-a; AltName: Full=Coiled-coil-helix-coiled-coil-helix domain-containing protein 6A [Xenopus laevis]